MCFLGGEPSKGKKMILIIKNKTKKKKTPFFPFNMREEICRLIGHTLLQEKFTQDDQY